LVEDELLDALRDKFAHVGGISDPVSYVLVDFEGHVVKEFGLPQRMRL